jgi:DNA polymerase alpha-associated DNA helicase A
MDKAVETLSYMFQVKHTSNPKQLPTVNGLHRVLMGLISLSPLDRNVEEPDWFDSSLNDSQREAVRFALSAPEVASIWGPPGLPTDLLRQYHDRRLQQVPGKHTL